MHSPCPCPAASSSGVCPKLLAALTAAPAATRALMQATSPLDAAWCKAVKHEPSAESIPMPAAATACRAAALLDAVATPLTRSAAWAADRVTAGDGIQGRCRDGAQWEAVRRCGRRCWHGCCTGRAPHEHRRSQICPEHTPNGGRRCVPQSHTGLCSAVLEPSAVLLFVFCFLFQPTTACRERGSLDTRRHDGAFLPLPLPSCSAAARAQWINHRNEKK